ncbi:MAG: DUF3047 domain-containing protein [Candidatus Eiseniibacteriota bacterium]
MIKFGLFKAALLALTVQAALAGVGWQELRLPGKTANEYVVTADGAIRVTSDRGTSFLYRPLSAAERRDPILAWRWKVDASGPATDLSKVGADDRPLAVHVWFRDGADEGLWPRLRRAALGLFGVPVPGHVLTYVWGGTEPAGTRLANPYLDGTGVLIVLRPGSTPTGVWYGERVDVAADYRRAFGVSPKEPAFVAISADTDDTASHSAGTVADLRFLPS